MVCDSLYRLVWDWCGIGVRFGRVGVMYDRVGADLVGVVPDLVLGWSVTWLLGLLKT